MSAAVTTLNESFVNGNSMNGHPLNGHPVNGHPVNGSPVTAAVTGDDAFEEVDVQRARLEADIVTAMGRTAAAKGRHAARDAEVRALLQAELLESKSTLARMEQEYEMAIAMVEQAAHDEVARIMDAARQQVVERRRTAAGSEGADHVQ